MKNRLILALGLVTLSAVAATTQEEAIILNQELQFLEDSVSNVQAAALNTSNESSLKKALNEKSLENTYFGEEYQEDTISTQTAGPKRRGL